MADRPPAVELRRSVSVLRTEWWLLVAAIAGYVLYGVWVLATGLAIDTLAPSVFDSATGLAGVAIVVWLLLPAGVATLVLEQLLSNDYDNLVSQYRIDHPGVLPAPPGVVVLLVSLIALVLGPRPELLAVLAAASLHLLVRTIAFGRRSYSFSPRPLFPVLTAVTAVAFGAAWLVHAPGLPWGIGTQVAAAGVGPALKLGLGRAGVAPAAALGLLVTVPALLSGVYMALQAAVARRVRAAAPLADPEKRAEQRYPIMPPVADSSRPGPPTPTTNGSSASADAGDSSSGTAEPSGTAESSASSGTAESADPEGAAESAESGTTGSTADTAEEAGTDDASHTQVFTTEEPIPDDEDMAAIADEDMAAVDDDGEDEAETDDGWIDDTAIFSPDGATSATDECGSCGESLPDESVTFCPNCGERVRR